MNHNNAFPETPNDGTLLGTLEWLTVSNAFDRSMKIAPVRDPLSASFLMKSVKRVTASSVERLSKLSVRSDPSVYVRIFPGFLT